MRPAAAGAAPGSCTATAAASRITAGTAGERGGQPTVTNGYILFRFPAASATVMNRRAAPR